MKKVIEVDEAIVNDICKKDAISQVGRDVIGNMLDVKKKSGDTEFLKSPVFESFQVMVAEQSVAFEKAKNSMLAQYVPKEYANRIRSWSLDYFTNKLTLII